MSCLLNAGQRCLVYMQPVAAMTVIKFRYIKEKGVFYIVHPLFRDKTRSFYPVQLSGHVFSAHVFFGIICVHDKEYAQSTCCGLLPYDQVESTGRGASLVGAKDVFMIGVQ